ncbi:MAG TPA: 4-(cytidine 5'-diphospho)-2-C-methyl-D-erythritol kinase [Thermoanaerobaculia bacterium]
MRLAVEAPAKVNRELRIGARRPDGYHEIRSRMVSIDLADRLEAEEGGAFTFHCDAPGVPSDGENLAARAARALADRTGRSASGHLALEKRVPAGSGLGGGSSDAAAALALLCALWRVSLDPSERLAIAGSLGSDVPFFLVGGEAEVTGRGEVVEAREDEAPRDLLLLVPPFSVATRDVYAAHRAADSTPGSLDIEESGRFLGRNDLEPAVVSVQPSMAAYLRSAREAAPEAGITGSGAAIVIAGADADAREWIARRHPDAALLPCRTLTRQEYRARISPTTGGAPWTSRR